MSTSLEFWIDVEAADGTRYGPGPILTATGWQMTPRLDGAGTFSFSMPASDPMSMHLLNKRIVRCRGTLNGVVTELGAGIIDKVEIVPGSPTMRTVSGNDIMTELAGPSVHGLVICEQAWQDLSDPTRGYYTQIGVSATGVPWDAQWEVAAAHDGNLATAGACQLMSQLDGYPEHAIWGYVGHDARFDRIKFTLLGGGRIATAGCVLIPQYYNGSGWVTLTLISDGTNDGSGTWRKSGEMVFARPADWVRYDEAYGMGGDWFWVRMRIARVHPANPSWTNYVDWAEIDVYADVPTTNGVNLIMAYAPATWTRTGYPATKSKKYLEFKGQTVLEALVILTEQGGTDGGAAVREHFRLGTGRAINWMGTTVVASGVRAVSSVDPIAAEGAPELVLIERLQKETDSAEVVTRIYPASADELGIGPATDAPPAGYTRGYITQGVNTFWYLQHTAGYGAYGLIERHVEFSELSLQQADSYTTHPIDLGNQLQGRGVEFLRTHAWANQFYRLSVVQFPAPILPGDTIECVYHEWIIDPVTGAVHTVDIDTIRDASPLRVLAPSLAIDGSGVSVQALEVATIDREPKTDARVVVDLVRRQRSSGAGNLASLAMIGAGTPPSAGADIRVSGYQVTRAGAGVLLFSGSGELLAEYSAIAGALAASVAGDLVRGAAGTYTENVTVPAGVTLEGLGKDATIFAGTILLGSGARFDHGTAQVVGDDAGLLYALTVGPVGTAYVGKDALVKCENVTGPAYAVYMTQGGNLRVDGNLLAEVGTDGYAAWVSSGNFYPDTGLHKGTVATYPYWKEL